MIGHSVRTAATLVNGVFRYLRWSLWPTARLSKAVEEGEAAAAGGAAPPDSDTGGSQAATRSALSATATAFLMEEPRRLQPGLLQTTVREFDGR